jgi:geranylgeranyl reductase
MMNPWQQLKLTAKTLASVLRGQALAPSGYQPVLSAVRTEEETQRMLAVRTIKGGIRMPAAEAKAESKPENTPEREPALSGR